MSLRYRIARRLVGYPFLPDPLEGQDGAFVIVREKGTVATIRAATFRLRSGMRPVDGMLSVDQPVVFGSTAAMERWGLIKRWGRFVGTVDYR